MARVDLNRVDLNSDLGEGYGSWTMGDDAAMLRVVTSANVACGYHAGDPTIMRQMCAAAHARGVAIGAHVAYPDRSGFGRRRMELSHDELADAVLYQLGALQVFARAAGSEITYVKPHGALYNTMAVHEAEAAAVVAGIQAFRRDLPMMGLPGSVALQVAAAAGLTPITEGFADRAYNPDGSLVSRRQAGAVLHDPAEIAARAVRMVQERRVIAVDGSELEFQIDSLCVHGDTPGAVSIAEHIRRSFEAAGVELMAFAPHNPT